MLVVLAAPDLSDGGGVAGMSGSQSVQDVMGLVFNDVDGSIKQAMALMNADGPCPTAFVAA